MDASLIEADANKQRSIRNLENDARSGAAAKDCLVTLVDAGFGAATNVVPKFISHSAQWTGEMRGPATQADLAHLNALVRPPPRLKGHSRQGRHAPERRKPLHIRRNSRFDLLNPRFIAALHAKLESRQVIVLVAYPFRKIK